MNNLIVKFNHIQWVVIILATTWTVPTLLLLIL